MKTADLITSFLNNEMTPEQERQFLLSVAASDSMRLSLKSHVMLDRISASQLHRAEVPVGVREAIFTQMSASMVEPMPANIPAQMPASHIGAAGGRFAGGLLRRYGNRAMTMLLTVGGFTAGYFAHSELQSPDATLAQPQQVQMAPATTSAAPVETPAAQPGAEVRQDAPAAISSSEPGESQAIAGAAQTGSPAAERSTRVVRQSSQRNDVRDVPVRQRERLSVPRGPLSDPLEPATRLKSPTAPASTAAAGPTTTIDTAAQNQQSQPMTIPSVSADGQIRKSNPADSQGIQTKQDD